MNPTLRCRAGLSCLFAALSSTLGTGCIETGADSVAVPLSIAGTDPSEGFAGRAQWHVQLDEASLVFGPLTLCAGATAASLCDTAHAEWQDSAVLDALNPKAKQVGELIGIGGTVRSWMYDLGFVSLLTSDEPLPTSAARKLGSSLRLRGSASHGERVLRFEARVDVRQELATERGVPVVSKSRNEHFERDLSEPGLGLLVRFDPSTWFEQVDFESIAEEHGCTDACDVELTLSDESQALRALRLALAAGEHPRFTWQRD